jgi:hypothetical protein
LIIYIYIYIYIGIVFVYTIYIIIRVGTYNTLQNEDDTSKNKTNDNIYIARTVKNDPIIITVRVQATIMNNNNILYIIDLASYTVGFPSS